MKSAMCIRRPVCCVALTTGTICAGIALIGGCPGVTPIGGDVGTLLGTVTNSLTDSGVPGAAVTFEPAVEGVDVTTTAAGTFSQQVPAGVYTLTFENAGFDAVTRTISVSAGGIVTVNAALTPNQPVIVTAGVDGDAVPGGSVTVTATAEVLDGSATVQDFAWMQQSGATAGVAGATNATATVTLPDAGSLKAELLKILAEPPIGEDELPPNVPLPEGEFPGGLQDRFQVVGLNPFALEEAALVTMQVAVATSAGTFTEAVEIHVDLPWKTSTGVRAVPVLTPVLLHGKTQSTYDWTLTRPAGSNAALTDSTTQSPYFTPDVAGSYTVTVTDTTVDPAGAVSLEVYGGTWQGAVTGQDASGRPLAANCTGCHNDTIASDKFTPWAQTGHAEIFTNNLNTSTHYGENCFACHTVGFDPEADNRGVDEAADYADFVGAGLLNNPGDNWTTVLSDFPDTARLANIQCENCHGPQNGGAHMTADARIDISSDVCAACHGEPLRHARFQQWQLSGHANYELAIDEGESGNCSRCHTANGFLTWLPVLLDDDPATDPLDDITVGWTADETHPPTCVTCHDPHSIGTTTGVTTDATVRISGNTPPLIAGFTAIGVGKGAICMTCHNSRRGLRNDDSFVDVVGTSEAARAPHGSAQTDVLMGENAFFVETGVRGNHSFVEDTCVNCHMEQTPPPALLSYNLGGTNHTFFASADICSKCHGEAFDATGVQTAFSASSDELGELIEAAILNLITARLTAGNTIDLNGEATITTTATIQTIAFGESRGRQAITVTFTDGTTFGPVRMNDVDVLDGTGAAVGELYDFADERLIKAGWNWNLANNDGSQGVHNPSFVFQALDAAIDELVALAAG